MWKLGHNVKIHGYYDWGDIIEIWELYTPSVAISTPGGKRTIRRHRKVDNVSSD